MATVGGYSAVACLSGCDEMEDKMSVEIRADGSLHIEGYVNAIERDSNPLNARGVGECVEQVKAGAFGMALRSAPNVDMLLNHDRGHKLAATSEGTLELREDSIGLKASADITDEFVISKAKSGLLRGWSFGFRATDQEIEQRSGKIPRRIIKSMDLFEVSVIDDTHTPCYNGCSLEYRADMVDDYEIRSTGNDTVVGAENATATEDTVTDTPEERGRSLELMRLELELMEMEARYNHYHDPHNGRFASGAGGGTGLYYSMGKGKGEIIGASSPWQPKKKREGLFAASDLKAGDVISYKVFDPKSQKEKATEWTKTKVEGIGTWKSKLYQSIIVENIKGGEKTTKITGLVDHGDFDRLGRNYGKSYSRYTKVLKNNDMIRVHANEKGTYHLPTTGAEVRHYSDDFD